MSAIEGSNGAWQGNLSLPNGSADWSRAAAGECRCTAHQRASRASNSARWRRYLVVVTVTGGGVVVTVATVVVCVVVTVGRVVVVIV